MLKKTIFRTFRSNIKYEIGHICCINKRHSSLNIFKAHILFRSKLQINLLNIQFILLYEINVISLNILVIKIFYTIYCSKYFSIFIMKRGLIS